jgi:hypothetical protein
LIKILENIKVTAPVNDGRDKKEKQKKKLIPGWKGWD